MKKESLIERIVRQCEEEILANRERDSFNAMWFGDSPTAPPGAHWMDALEPKKPVIEGFTTTSRITFKKTEI